MLCRQDKRKLYLRKILSIAEKEDKVGWFQEPYEQEEYKRIIKNPMCFSMMKNNMELYIVNIELFKEHFNLIFTNAYNYNKPKDRAYKDAERVQEAVNKLLSRKWEKLIEKQDMTIEEIEHQNWIIQQVQFDPDFLNKSEDVIVPPKNFRYIPHKAKQENEEMAEFINESEAPKSVIASPNNSDNEESILSAKLRKRKRNMKYTETDNFTTFSNEAKGLKLAPSDSFKDPKKIDKMAKLKKNQDIEFSSDEEIKDIKDITLNDIDFSNPKNLTAKRLLEKPELLEDMDLKQYYLNPVRCCFDDPSLIFSPIWFLWGAFDNPSNFLFWNLWGESFHPYWEKFSSWDLTNMQEYWKCQNWKYCEIWSSADKEKNLLYWDVWDKAFHTFWLKPKLNTVPSCDWKCND